MPHRRLSGWILLMGALTAIGPLSIDMYLPAFPAIAHEFSALGRVELTLASFFTGLALGQLFYGPVSDRFGRKPPLYAGLALYVAGSLGAAGAGSVEALVAWRFLQGLGGCAGMVIARAVVRDRCTPAEAAQAFSLLMLVMGLAPILAPLAGSYLLQLGGWRALFLVLASFGAGCLLLVRGGLGETLRQPLPRLEAGRVLRAYGGLLRDPHFRGHVLASGLAFSGMFAYIAGSPFVLMQLFGLDAHRYGWVFGANALGLIAASQLNARLLRRGRLDMRQLLRRGLASAALAGLALFALALADRLPLPVLLCGLFLYLASLGFISPNASASALAGQGHQAGTASALMGALQFLLATMAGVAMGLWHDGTALPLATALALFGGAGWWLHRRTPAALPPSS
jgi:DHA1 family bicyclomycin/chloramphenicol resistance-like MFS transporter